MQTFSATKINLISKNASKKKVVIVLMLFVIWPQVPFIKEMARQNKELVNCKEKELYNYVASFYCFTYMHRAG
jgi:hypothetical protein